MITPRFKLDQTDEHLLVDIRVPYAKVIFKKILSSKTTYFEN